MHVVFGEVFLTAIGAGSLSNRRCAASDTPRRHGLARLRPTASSSQGLLDREPAAKRKRDAVTPWLVACRSSVLQGALERSLEEFASERPSG